MPIFGACLLVQSVYVWRLLYMKQHKLEIKIKIIFYGVTFMMPTFSNYLNRVSASY